MDSKQSKIPDEINRHIVRRLCNSPEENIKRLGKYIVLPENFEGDPYVVARTLAYKTPYAILNSEDDAADDMSVISDDLEIYSRYNYELVRMINSSRIMDMDYDSMIDRSYRFNELEMIFMNPDFSRNPRGLETKEDIVGWSDVSASSLSILIDIVTRNREYVMEFVEHWYPDVGGEDYLFPSSVGHLVSILKHDTSANLNEMLDCRSDTSKRAWVHALRDSIELDNKPNCSFNYYLYVAAAAVMECVRWHIHQIDSDNK